MWLNKFYFAYGSNLSKDQMLSRCPDSVPFAKAILLDYELTFKANRRGRGVADVIPSPGRRVVGALYEVSKSDLKKLDRFEGHPYIYERQEVTVISNLQKVDAIIYVMKPEFLPKVPNEDYYKRILTGYYDWGLTEDHLSLAVKRIKK